MKPILLLLIFITILYIGFYFTNKYNDDFSKNSIETTAIITDIVRDNSLVDIHGDDRILNYMIEYSFKVNNSTVTSFDEIDFDEYNLYFKHQIEIGDSITILYHKEKPKNSQIKRLPF